MRSATRFVSVDDSAAAFRAAAARLHRILAPCLGSPTDLVPIFLPDVVYRPAGAQRDHLDVVQPMPDGRGRESGLPITLQVNDRTMADAGDVVTGGEDAVIRERLHTRD
jgi:hypothetical protein